jgi:phosphotriesterase-related protein
MSAAIQTVLGPISPEDLGFTSMHEHVLLDVTVYHKMNEEGLSEEDTALWKEALAIDTLPALRKNALLMEENLLLDNEEHMAEELAEYRRVGGSALLDVSGIGIRTDVAGVRRLSEGTGVHVVTSTGFYIEPAWPEEIGDWTAADFEARMMDEIDSGIGNTGVRAGHIKVGITDPGDRQRQLDPRFNQCSGSKRVGEVVTRVSGTFFEELNELIGGAGWPHVLE